MRADGAARPERRLWTGALRALLVLSVPSGVWAGLVAGTPGVLGALAALAMVALLFAGGARLLPLLAGRRPATVAGTMVMGMVGRLLAYAAVLAGLSRLEGVHRPSVALTAAVAVAVVTVYELRVLARSPRLFWVDVEPRTERPRAVSDPTRSQLL